MDPIALFGIIHGSHNTISANFYLYLLYFQLKVFSFNKISGSQTDPKIILLSQEELQPSCLGQLSLPL